MKHTLAILVQNRSGVLARVAGLFSRRGFNIESIAVGRTELPGLSRMTIVSEADDATLEQITKQLHKLIDVVKISDITSDDFVDRELALLKVSADSRNRSEILQVVEIFRGKIVDVSETAMIIEVTGDENKIDAFVQLARPYGIKELVRTGKIAMVRGPKTTTVETK
ncbi:MAG TPA: acetolactate synthase small subunit [Firmicutes bacterium]|nr:acetolactate synthase small subunit [Bacillota bacterium]HHY97348.1 acetolactate synthase small subunit [Bacillota bacterium]